ncbi:MAG: hypothetical protein GY859_44655, partial [Desulfobacterales bacterium]|nr:hypothetical protein [Desulfobacterales bacterium]
AAVEKLSPGEIVFFPEENLKDLASRTELTAHAKGVILQPVKTVEEAINKLLAAASIIEEPANSATAPAIEPPVRKKTPWRPLLFSLCIIAAALAAYHLFKSENTPPPSPGAIESSKLVSPPPPNPTARERAKPAAPARTGPMESEPKEHAAGPGAETNQVSTPPREPGPNAAASSTPVSPERSERGALERPEPASPSAQIPISTEPIKTAHKITPDAKISPNHIKKPAPEKPPARSNRPLHVKIALKGSDDLALAAVSEAIASELEDLGYIIDDQDYDGVISAAVSLTGGEEIPLRPHAGDSEIL